MPPSVKAAILEKWRERFEPTTTAIKGSALELLERMVAVGENE
jgi:hypothetical protein